MEGTTKQEIQQEIVSYQIKQEIEAIVRKAIDEFKKYARVDKRFIDHLNTLGLHAWRNKGDFDRVYIRFNKSYSNGTNPTIELSVYNKSFTWEELIKQLDRCSHAQLEQEYKEKLAAFDNDLVVIKDLLTYIKSLKLKNYSLYDLERQLDKAIWESREKCKN